MCHVFGDKKTQIQHNRNLITNLIMSTGLLLGISNIALAQGASLPKTNQLPQNATIKTLPPAAATETVVVTAARPDVVQSANSTTYNVGNNHQNATSTAQEILSSLPNINVTAQGELVFRGEKGGIVVMVNGNHVPLESALLLPGATIDSITVVANPSALSGSAIKAIIIINQKQGSMKPISGDLSTQIDTLNAMTLTGTAKYKRNKLSIASDITLHGHGNKKTSYLQRNEFFESGINDARLETSDRISLSDRFSLNAQNRVNIGLNNNNLNIVWYHTQSSGNSRSVGKGTIGYNAGLQSSENYRLGLVDNYNLRSNTIAFGLSETKLPSAISRRSDPEFRGGYHATFTNSVQNSNRTEERVFSSNPSNTQNRIVEKSGQRQAVSVGRSLDHKFKNKTQLKLKLEAQNKFSKSTGIHSGFAETSEPVASIFKINEFEYSAAGTIEREFDKLQILGGLRYEVHRLNLAANGNDINTDKNYAQLIPSLHIVYRINDDLTFKSSFSRRTSPYSLDYLNPTLVFTSPDSATQGNPYLKLPIINSYDAELIIDIPNHSVNLTGFYKDRKDEISPFYKLGANNIIVTSYANIGHSSRGGLSATIRNIDDNKYSYSFEYAAIETRLSAIPQIDFHSDSFVEQTGKIILGYKPNNKNSLGLQIDYTGPTYGIYSETSELTNIRFTATHIFANGWTGSLDYFDVIGSPNSISSRQNANLSSISISKTPEKSLRLSLAVSY